MAISYRVAQGLGGTRKTRNRAENAEVITDACYEPRAFIPCFPAFFRAFRDQRLPSRQKRILRCL